MQKYLTSEEVDRRIFFFSFGKHKNIRYFNNRIRRNVINRDRRRKGMRRGGGRKKEV